MDADIDDSGNDGKWAGDGDVRNLALPRAMSFDESLRRSAGGEAAA